jgi:molybdate transport system ATP-binding protein
MSLHIEVEFARAAFNLSARCEIGAGVTGICGESGAGKTTLLALLAGLLRPQQGRIALDGEVLVDTRVRRFVPPWRRRFGVVFQDGLLFPHLRVLGNLLYGAQRLPPAQRHFRLDDVVQLLELTPLLRRRPAQLSGGEQQRVALGRALLSSPRLLLLDEPLASLDERLKQQILPYLRRVKASSGIPMIYVSHSRDEVSYLADRVLWMHGGQLAATAPAITPPAPELRSMP